MTKGWRDNTGIAIRPPIIRVSRQVIRAVAGGRIGAVGYFLAVVGATVGGSIGNDACGNHSVRHGRTSDHVVSLDLVMADGARLTASNLWRVPRRGRTDRPLP